jgi:hypothetical protein
MLSPPRRRSSPVPTTSVWRWSPASPAHVQESAQHSVHRLEGGGVGGALCQGYTGSCGSCGWLESGSSSIFPRRESTASFDPWAEGLGACPRPMFFHCCLHSGLRRRMSFAALSKLPCDEAPPDLGWPWPLLLRRQSALVRWQRSMESSGVFGKLRLQGLHCNFCFW